MKIEDIYEMLYSIAYEDHGQDTYGYTGSASACMAILDDSPLYKIYDEDALFSVLTRMNLCDEEKELIIRNLPHEDFTVQVANKGTVFYSKMNLNAREEKPGCKHLWQCYQVSHHSEEKEIMGFFGDVKMIDDNGQLTFKCDIPPSIKDRDEYRRQANDVLTNACSILKMLSVCRKQVVNVPVSDKVARKRAKHGKRPAFQYKILTLDPIAINQLPKQQRAQVTGRMSPTTHERAGHRRRLKNDAYTWVRSCIINAPYYADGIIVKDYDIKVTE